MNNVKDTDSVYRAVVEVLTNNYTANLFSSLQRENLAKKVSHKLEVMLEIDKPNNVATHMGDQIIEDENINDGPCTYLLAHRGCHYDFNFNVDSIVVDPWREFEQNSHVLRKIIHYGKGVLL